MHEVILEEPAKQFIRTLNKKEQKEILDKLEKLKTNPRLGKPLKKRLAGLWSLKFGKYRVIYTIKDIELIVLVLKTGHRKDIYNI